MSRWMAFAYDRLMRGTERACLEAWRHDLLAGLSGNVLEIGAGTGANLTHYPEAVTRLVLTEADPAMLAKLEDRMRAGSRSGVEVRGASAESLPVADASFDVVVSTLVLCSVANVDATLAEVRRVLRPGGSFVYLEHVAAEEASSRFTWQQRIEPFWMRLAGNCHLTRRTGEAIRCAGFVVEAEEHESMRKAMPFLRPTVRGVARAI